jgi:hypothetical protein
MPSPSCPPPGFILKRFMGRGYDEVAAERQIVPYKRTPMQYMTLWGPVDWTVYP